MNGYRHLITTVDEGVGILQLNHPEKRNALGWELHEDIIAALGAWAYDDDVAAVLLIGNEDYFCAGWALDVLQDTGGDTRTRFTDLDAHEALRVGLADEVVPAGQLRASALRLARQIAEHGAELTTVLKEVALRATDMDHIAATAYELRVTHDLLQRGLFTDRLDDGLRRLRAGQSRATERLATGQLGERP
jgi:enoyl-CoA hydratase/carnithine racemase